MYTQCPQCQTLYRVTAELLRAARGQVQCGRCAAVFDALSFLVEDEVIDSHAPDAGATGQHSAGHHVPLPAGSTTEVQRRGDASLDAASFGPAETPEQSLEFNLPPDAVDRVFVEAPKATLPAFATVAVLSDSAEVHIIEQREAAEEIDIPLEVADPSNDPVAVEVEPDSVDEPPEIDVEETWDVHAVPEEEEPAAEAEGVERPKHIVESDEAAVADIMAAGDPANDDRVPLELRRRSAQAVDNSATDGAVEFGDTAVLKERAVHYGWRAGAIVLALALLAQIVHHDRHDLVRRPSIGPMLQRIYAAFGAELSPQWNLKAYEVRQWGAAAAPGAQGTLRVRASVVNTADHAQPLPLLRLSLADLAGSRVGVRDFEPKEYLTDPSTQERMLAAGRRIDAEVVIVDPGKDAVGFEIDVCLRDDEHHISCANDPAPAT